MTIDHAKSIARGKITTISNDWSDKLEVGNFYFANGLFLIFLLVVPIIMLIQFYLSNDMHVVIIIVGGTQLIFGVYLLYCMFQWQRLVKIDGLDMATNKELLIPIVNGYYPDLEYEWDKDILIGSKPMTVFKGGVNVVILFNDNDIYLNVLSIYRGGPNPWMAATNLERAKEIGRLFKERMWHSLNNRSKNTSHG